MCKYVPGMSSACVTDGKLLIAPIAFAVAGGLTYLGLSGKLKNLLPC